MRHSCQGLKEEAKAEIECHIDTKQVLFSAFKVIRHKQHTKLPSEGEKAQQKVALSEADAAKGGKAGAAFGPFFGQHVFGCG